jgi:hypothetical protein
LTDVGERSIIDECGPECLRSLPTTFSLLISAALGMCSRLGDGVGSCCSSTIATLGSDNLGGGAVGCASTSSFSVSLS